MPKYWQTWATKSANVVFFTPGIKQLRILIKAGPVNLNWLDFGFLTETKEPVENVTIMLYPNPNSGQFFITGKLQQPQAATIEVFNVLGKSVLLKEIATGSQLLEELDLTSFGKGNYFVKVMLENGKQEVLKVLTQ